MEMCNLTSRIDLTNEDLTTKNLYGLALRKWSDIDHERNTSLFGDLVLSLTNGQANVFERVGA
jgi:hypothetical protein